MIVNLKTIRNLFYFLKVNENLKKAQYIFFCYNIKLTPILKNTLTINHITYSFLKKLKCLNYLKFVQVTLSNSLIIFSCNDELACNKLLDQVSSNILLAKIKTNFYSLNNLHDYCKIDAKTFCYQNFIHYYYQNIFSIVQLLENQKKNLSLN